MDIGCTTAVLTVVAVNGPTMTIDNKSHFKSLQI